jgi:hypothetical protein
VTGGSDKRAAAIAWPPDAPALYARAFGGAEDLDVDFALPRPKLVTRILALCLRDVRGEPWPEDALWQWTLPQRAQALLAVARACGVDAVAAVARCARPECGEQLELELELASFVREAQAPMFSWRGKHAELSLRLPTGADQLDWLEGSDENAGVLAALMATGLVREIDGAAPDAAWRLPEAWLPEIEDALAERDPTTALSVNAPCAACGHDMEIDIDLEALLLERLARVQRVLLFEVHALASGYHWSEPQILALPAWRRTHYLGALRAEA